MLPQYAPTRFLRVPSGNIFNKLSRPGLTSLFSTLADTGLVECVPNFSEGRDEKVIEAIAEACRATPGCSLLDVDPGFRQIVPCLLLSGPLQPRLKVQ